MPGSIHNPLARGCHRLIRDGARLAETAAEMVEALAPAAQALGADLRARLDGSAGRRLASCRCAATIRTTPACWPHSTRRPLDMDELVARTG